MSKATPPTVRFDRHRLNNGLTLLLSESQRIPLVSINAFVLAGQDQNPSQQPGTAALTSRMVDEGTHKYSAHQIAEIVESTGGSMATFSERELSGVSLFMRSEHLPRGLDLMQEMLINPVFPEDRFELEQEKVLSRIEAAEDDPQVVASKRFNGWVYEGSPLQHPILGTRQSVAQMQVSQVRDFHGLKYAPENTIVVIVGAIDSSDVLEEVAERFSNWENESLSLNDLPALQRQTSPIVDEYYMDKGQITILLGHLGVARSNPDHHSLQVMDVILGSGPGFTSRIPKKLRDEQGLAYHTYSDISGSSGIHHGRFVAFINTSPENRKRALDGLLQEIQTFAENGVTQEELETAQDYLTGNFVFEFQSNVSTARFLLATELFELGPDYAERYEKIIRAIDCEEISRVARLYLDTLNYTTVVVGPTDEGKPHNGSERPTSPAHQN